MVKASKGAFDVVSIGDTSRDSFMGLHLASLRCDARKMHCDLCLKYAQKITVDGLFSSVGGNACNNAVGSSRLGLKAALYTRIGDDEIGDSILAQLKRERVSDSYVVVEKNGRSNFSVVLDFKGDRTELVYHAPRTYALPPALSTKWLYLTSLGKDFGRIHRQIASFVSRTGTRLAFNPDSYQLTAGLKGLSDVLRVCSFLIVNKDEASALIGKRHDADSVNDLLMHLKHAGPKLVVITDGKNGAYAYDGKELYRQPILPAKAVERTGAGDAFAAAFLAALVYRKPIHEALRWGTVNSASVIEHIGPENGLLTKAGILKRIAASQKKRA